MSFEPLDDVRHVLDEVAYLRGAGANIDESTFLSDATLQRAFIRSLEVIGEATKRLPPESRAAHPEVDGRGMAGMRDRLIHGYFGVDHELVWEVVRSRVPEPQRALEPLLDDRSRSCRGRRADPNAPSAERNGPNHRFNPFPIS